MHPQALLARYLTALAELVGVEGADVDDVIAGGVESMSRWDVTAGAPTIDGNNTDLRALIGTVLDELERRDLTTDRVTMCTGGGMGTATIVERV